MKPLLALLLFLLATPVSHAADIVALCIGNDAYVRIPKTCWTRRWRMRS